MDGDSILYEFLINGDPVTDWRSRNTWIMETSERNYGNYRVSVRVRDGNHAGEDSYDDEQSGSFDIVKKALSGTVTLGGSKTYSRVLGPAYTNWKPSYTPGPDAYPIGT
jgi:hypothetical protein